MIGRLAHRAFDHGHIDVVKCGLHGFRPQQFLSLHTRLFKAVTRRLDGVAVFEPRLKMRNNLFQRFQAQHSEFVAIYLNEGGYFTLGQNFRISAARECHSAFLLALGV